MSQRLRLAAELRRLRMSAGLSGYELARRLSLSQTKVSRIETGRKTPSADEVRAWGEATGASGEGLARLLEQADSALTEVATLRVILRQGIAEKQRQVGALEATASTIRTFQPVLVPGLLQTADYARRIFTSIDLPGRLDVAAATAARVERQAVLYDQAKRFEFLIGEAALRWGFGPRETLWAQLDRLRSLSTLPNLIVGIIPFDAELAAWHSHGFAIFDDREDDLDPFVVVETLTAELTVTELNDVAVYQEAFARLRHVALFDAEAEALLSQIMRAPGAS